MKQKLFTLLLALIGLTTTVCAEDYGISIGGIRLTSDNYNNITSAGGFPAVASQIGTIVYMPSSRKLRLSNANIISTDGAAINISPSDGEDYTIELVSGTSNWIEGGLRTSAQTYIMGGGTGVFTSENDCGIYAAYSNSAHDYTLYIIGGTRVISRGQWGIAGFSASYGTLRVSNSTVEATGAQGSICDLDQLSLSECAILQPAEAQWNATAGGVYVGNDLVTERVLIGSYTELQTSGRLNTDMYDTNGDGKVTLADLTTLADILVGRIKNQVTSITFNPPSRVQIGSPLNLNYKIIPADATYSGLFWKSYDPTIATVDQTGRVTGVSEGTTFISAYAVDGSDKSATIQITVLNPTVNGHTSVDLGLPSGTLWATTNIGATSESDYGDYFAWGNYETQSYYVWDRYKYGGESTLTKYCTMSRFGSVDNIKELERADDAAYKQWGSGWRMPSKEQWDELRNYTTMTTATVNGVAGYRLTSTVPGYTNKSIFLPAAGIKDNVTVSNAGEHATYWSRNIDNNYPCVAYIFSELNDANSVSVEYRCKGLPIRPVRDL